MKIRMKSKFSLAGILVVLIIAAGVIAFIGLKGGQSGAGEGQALAVSGIENSSLVSFMVSKNLQQDKTQSIEIFDTGKEQVIKRVESSPAIQKEVSGYLKGISGLYTRFNPIPRKGIMIKIPVVPPVEVKNKWVNQLVNEVIVLFPAQGEPYLMIFQQENKPLFFTFKGNTANLLKELNFQLKQGGD